MTAPSFWGRLFGGLFGTKRLDKDSKAESHRGSSTASGNPVTPETALKLAAVWACVRLRSQTIASLPLHLYNEDKTIAKDHYLYRILHDSPIHRHTGGLEMHSTNQHNCPWIHRHTGGLEKFISTA